MENNFLKNVGCTRCNGPLLALASQRTTFIEEGWIYIVENVWLCYACGKEHTEDQING